MKTKTQTNKKTHYEVFYKALYARMDTLKQAQAQVRRLRKRGYKDITINKAVTVTTYTPEKLS